MRNAKLFAVNTNSARSRWRLKPLLSEPGISFRENQYKVKENVLNLLHQGSILVMLHRGKNFRELDSSPSPTKADIEMFLENNRRLYDTHHFAWRHEVCLINHFSCIISNLLRNLNFHVNFKNMKFDIFARSLKNADNRTKYKIYEHVPNTRGCKMLYILLFYTACMFWFQMQRLNRGLFLK